MKAVNKICQVLAILFGLGSLVLFFLSFAKLTINGQVYTFTGAQLALGTSKELAGELVANMAKSADLLFCMVLTLIGLACSVFSYKQAGFRYAASGFALGTAIYMLVVRLSSPWKFVDTRADLSDAKYEYFVTDVKYTSFVLFIVIALFLFAAAAIANLLLSDAIEVAESKGAKKPILKRIVLFFRDYKSEAKKIVWPGLRDVLKNTVIVLIMCLLIGALIWLVDLGLGTLLDWILGLKS